MKQLPLALTPYTAVTWTPTPPHIPEPVFLKPIPVATKYVQFSFNNNTYQQINGISMGSPLGAALVNIFVGFQEARLFKITNILLFYQWYNDNTFMMFFLKSESRCFFYTVNILHWHSPVNLNTTACLFLMLSTPILVYRLQSIISSCLLDHTHNGGHFASSDTKLI